MRVKVIKQFIDKYTNNLHKVGDVLDIDKGRVEEINSTRYGIFVKVAEVNLSEMTKKEIVEYAKGKGISLDTKMTKAEMIKELM